VHDIIIVGAGAAGIGAARACATNQLDVVVLESLGRVGGRAHTDISRFARPIDLGCQWLHSADRNPLTQHAMALDIEIDKGESVRSIAGRDASAYACWAAYEQRQWERLKEGGLQDVPVSNLLEQDHPYTALFDAWLAMICGRNAVEISTIDHLRYVDTGKNWNVAGGYGALVERLAAGLRIETQCTVERIAVGADRVNLETSRGRLVARGVIVTAATNVLANGAIEFTPNLDSIHDRAFGALPLGSATKLVFALHRQVSDERLSVFSSTDADAVSFQILPGPSPVAIGYVGGRRGKMLEDMPVDAALAIGRTELERCIEQDLIRDGGFRTGWGHLPSIQGAYSAARPGCADARRDLMSPHCERVLFAGEAVHQEFYSTAHGAFLSGERAARAAARLIGDT
jgi:monoamine oxidase